ncbi:MAG: phosphomethylpyrimidine synthase ThiC [Desulfobacterales bacterium]|nr:phosphomethylpyrimidine synthase ThiC [Desulfobacterales bacterium]
MELLAGGDLDEVRRAVLNATSLPVGNVPAEHLALPYVEDVREGVRATKIAARIGDIAKYLNRRENEKKETCTMCGDFCAMKKGMEVFKEDIKKDKINSIV